MRSLDEALSADERLAEVARILAAGIARLKQRGSEDSWHTRLIGGARPCSVSHGLAQNENRGDSEL